ncbi:MAG: SEL1-like repeat protein [Nitrospinota bacterium]|nr:SEL1-like repeat protein [Nitrospinota bacterium]
MYEHGKGVPLDNVEAVSWYRLAAEQGHEAARRRLDFLLCKGGE